MSWTSKLLCPKCAGELGAEDFSIIGVAAGNAEINVAPALDIICDCPHCSAKVNGFLSQDDLMVIVE